MISSTILVVCIADPRIRTTPKVNSHAKLCWEVDLTRTQLTKFDRSGHRGSDIGNTRAEYHSLRSQIFLCLVQVEASHRFWRGWEYRRRRTVYEKGIKNHLIYNLSTGNSARSQAITLLSQV